MAFNTLRSVVCKPVAGQYFIFGMIVGVTLGLFVMAPLNRITVNTSFLRVNISDAEVLSTTVNPSIEVLRHLQENKSLADQLHDEVRVLCWIMTGPKNHETKARHIKNTWGKRCNILLFMSTQEDPSLPAIALPVIEDRPNLWGKTKEAFKYVYEHYYDQADWFFKADDDTYTIMENMRYMLRNENTSNAVYFGYRFKLFVRQGYMSGGAGYVLSKEALRRFINESLPYPEKCKQKNIGNEDVEMGKCLESVGVEAGDSRDIEGKSRFMPLFISPILTPGQQALPDKHWLWTYNYYPLKRGMDCCSDYIIAIHYVDTRTMYLLEYMTYHVKPYGLPYNSTSEENNKDSDNIQASDISVNNENRSKEIVTKQSSTQENEASWNNFD